MTGYRQLVPRPPAAVRIGPPPWVGSPVRWSQVASLVSTLPAEADGAPDSAVLVPVYKRAGDAVLVLIRRSALLLRDPGHVAFPGGRIEPGESPLEAALREASEEVGLAPAAVAATGALGVYGRRERHVAAFLAVLDGRPRLAPDPGEVDVLIETPLRRLLGEGACWEERWGGAPMYFFAFGPDTATPRDQRSPELAGDLVWGLTAGILWDLLSRLSLGPQLTPPLVPPPS